MELSGCGLTLYQIAREINGGHPSGGKPFMPERFG